VREAIEALRAEGLAVKLIALRLIAPAQPERIAAALAGVKRLLIIEQSHSGQFWRYLRAHCELPAEVVPIHRAGPLPIRPGEARDHIRKGISP
jgi:2-oxoglutarate ferredoxin oxidoreductase subunit alpha